MRWSVAAVPLALLMSGCATFAPHGVDPYARAEVDVRRCGACGDGVRDDTAAFLRAIERATPGHGVVRIPPGRYRITAPLTLDGVAIAGTRPGGFPADIDALPVLEIVHADGPAIVAGDGASISGLVIRFPPRNDLERPPAILLSGIGVTVERVKIRGAWDGIISDGVSNCGRVNLRDIFMPNCFHTGVYLTRTLDVANLDNIEIWSPDRRAMEGGAVGFRFGRNDELRAVNLFAFAMDTGMLFDLDVDDTGELGGHTYGEFANCCTDYCAVGVRVTAPVRIGFAGGSFLNHQQSFIIDDPEATVRIAAADLQSNGAPAVQLETAGRFLMHACTLRRVCGAYHLPRILAHDVEALVVTGCVFDPNGPGIRFGPDVAAATVRSNIFESDRWLPFVDADLAPGRIIADGNLTPAGPVPPPGEEDLRGSGRDFTTEDTENAETKTENADPRR